MRRGRLFLALAVAAGLVLLLLLARQDDDATTSGDRDARDDPRAGPASLRGHPSAHAPGGAGAVPVDEASEPSAGARRVIEGFVVDLEEKPVADMPLFVRGREVVRSDALGRFQLLAGTGLVAINTPPGWRGFAHVRPGDDEPVRIQVVKVETLVITVTDEVGRPASGVIGRARIGYISDWQNGSGSFQEGSGSWGPTDAEGRYELKIPVSATVVEVEAWEEKDRAAKAEVDFPTEREVVLRLRARLRITGQVVNRDGKGVERGVLTLEPLDPAGRLTPVCEDLPGLWDFVEDGEEVGEFCVPLLDPGPYVVQFAPSDVRLAPADPVRVAAPGKDLRLVCPPGRVVTGRIEGVTERLAATWIADADAGSGLRRASRACLAEADGTFELQGVAEEPGRLFVWSPQDDLFALLAFERPPTKSVHVVLEAGVALEGRVVGYVEPEADPGPIGRDRALRIHAEGSGVHAWASVQRDGSFRMAGLPPDVRYDLSWRQGTRRGRFREAQRLDPSRGSVELRSPR